MGRIFCSFLSWLGAAVMLMGDSSILTIVVIRFYVKNLALLKEAPPQPNILWFPHAFPYIVSSFDSLFTSLILSCWYKFSSADLHFSLLRKETFLVGWGRGAGVYFILFFLLLFYLCVGVLFVCFVGFFCVCLCGFFSVCVCLLFCFFPIFRLSKHIKIFGWNRLGKTMLCRALSSPLHTLQCSDSA